MAKKIDPKAKAKRQKIYAAIGGVILLGLLAFQVPRTLKMMHPAEESSSSSTPAATTAPTTSPIAAPSLGGGNATAAAAAPGGDGLVDADAPPPAQFGQQLELNGESGSAGATTPPAAGATGATGAKPSSASASGGAKPATTTVGGAG